MWFQHDGAPVYFSIVVRAHETFGQRWTVRGRPVSWLARSPDLNPLYFFFWVYSATLLYVTLVNDLEGL